MRRYLLAILVMVSLISCSTIGYASILSTDSNPANYDHPLFYNDNIKIELHFDNDGNGIDPDMIPDKCKWYNPFEWLDKDGVCENEAYDYILNPSTDEVVGEWSMFKLQRMTGSNWKTLKVLNHRFEDCSSEGVACVKRQIKFDENTEMNVSYILKDNDEKVKFDIHIKSGISNGEYRMKYKLDSAVPMQESGNKNVAFNPYAYDWNDITQYPVSYSLSEDGMTLEQTTDLGVLPKDEIIYIDPLITADATATNPTETTLLKASNDDLYFITKNTTHRLVYVSNDYGQSWSLNSTNNTYFDSTRSWTTVIDSNDVIHIVEEGISYGVPGVYGLYGNYTPSTNTWMITNSTSLPWTTWDYIVSDIDRDDNIFVNVITNTGSDIGISYKNSTGWFVDTYFALGPYASRANSISTSADFVMLGNTHAGFNDLFYQTIFDKSIWDYNTTLGDYNDMSQTILDADSMTIDYDNNKILGISIAKYTGPPVSLMQTFYVFNGTNQVMKDSTNTVLSQSPFNLTDTVYLAKYNITGSEKYYVIYADDGAGLYGIEIESIDWTTGNVVLSNYNSTSNIVSTYFNFTSVMDDQYPVEVTAEDIQIAKIDDGAILYAYKTSGGADWYFDTYPKGITINTWDEETGNIITDWDIYITNGTISETLTAIDAYANNWVGDVTIKISKTGYYDRYYYHTIENYGDYYLLDAYLLNISDGQIVTFATVDQYGNSIPDVYLSAERSIDSIWTLVEEKYTDDSGTASMFLDPDTEYRIGASKSGYSTALVYITPTLNQYTITLVKTSGYVWEGYFYGISKYELLPSLQTYSNNSTISNTFEIISNPGTLAWWYMNITWYDGTNLFYENTTNSSGLMNFTNTYTTPGNYTVNVTFQRNDYALPYSMTRLYYIVNVTTPPSNMTLDNLSDQITSVTGTQKIWILSFVSLVIALALAAWLSSYSGTGAAIAAGIWLGMATAMGWFDPYIYTLSLLLLGMMIFLQWKGYGGD